MTVDPLPTDDQTRRVELLLHDKFAVSHPDAEITVYRYNPASIRVRIISNAFQGKTIGERDREIGALLEDLPDEIYDDVSFLLCLAPNEVEQSIANVNFERPFMPAL